MPPRASADQLPPPGWFVASFLLYVALGLVFKTAVLNWIVGPLWLLLTIWFVPAAFRRLTTRSRP